MADKVEGVLEVGTNDKFEVVINHPDLKPNENGVGHIVFSPDQALHLANTLIRKAQEARHERLTAEQRERRRLIALRSVSQKGYVVLSPAERAKVFVRPVRYAYVHVGKPPEGEHFEYPITRRFPGGCGHRTEMAPSIAETYARCPTFYSGTYCCSCQDHFPLDQFVWEGTTEQVGS